MAFSALGQGTETFTNMPANSSSYASRTWLGDNNLSWTATDARTDQVINSRAITIRNGSLFCSDVPNGIATLSFKHQQFFTGSNPVLQVYINGNLVGSVNPSTSVATATLTGINIADAFDLEIRQVTAGLRIGIDDLTWTSYSANPCTAPTAQPTGLTLNSISSTQINGIFFEANPEADNYLIVRTITGDPAPVPVNGTNYNEGQTIGSGIVVQNYFYTNFTANGLTPATNYTFYIFSHNNLNCSGGPLYLLSSPLTNSASTPPLAPCITPGAAPSILNLTPANTSVSGSFSASASANRYLVVRSLNTNLSSNPVNGTTYTTGQSLGGGTVVAYSNSTSFLAGGLTLNTPYYFFVFAANSECTGEPVYLSSSLNGSATTTNIASNLPPNYYSSTTGLTCAPLKTALSTIITTGAIQLTYTPGVWTAYLKTDIKRNFENTRDIIWDMYSDRGAGQNEPYEYVYGTNQCGNYSKESDCYNREHSFPQSWFVGGTYPMYSDIHHLFPTDGWVNALRSSFPFGEVTTVEITTGNPTQNGSKRGTGAAVNFGYTGTVFEPINEYKGDFARAQLYMATRYESQIAGWQNNGSANEVLNGTSYQAFDDWQLQLLYKWHLQDPVSDKERARNDSVFVVQNNRNPFIDNPQWVFDVWSCTGLLTATSVNDVLRLPVNAVRLYPNPVINSNATIHLEKAFTQTTTLVVMDVMGRFVNQQIIPAGQTVITLPSKGLSKGMYVAKIQSRDGIVTRNFVVQ
jgi:endonuclease I